jgi:superoxide dismutase
MDFGSLNALCETLEYMALGRLGCWLALVVGFSIGWLVGFKKN